jgi:hypothetical protein
MTVRYMHIRWADEEGNIQPTGGVTLAYTTTDKDIVAAWTKCRFDELFCFAKGRFVASEKLKNPEGQFDILPLCHPISEVLAEYIATDVWPNTMPSDLGYRGDDMGYPIDVYKDERNRWISTFEPSPGLVQWNPTPNELFDSAFHCDPI